MQVLIRKIEIILLLNNKETNLDKLASIIQLCSLTKLNTCKNTDTIRKMRKRKKEGSVSSQLHASYLF